MDMNQTVKANSIAEQIDVAKEALVRISWINAIHVCDKWDVE